MISNARTVSLDDRFSGSGLICCVLKDVKGGAEFSTCVFMTSLRNHEGNFDIHRTELNHEVVPVYVMTAYGCGSIAPFILNLITSDTGGVVTFTFKALYVPGKQLPAPTDWGIRRET
jgi:hypothetical protein